MFDHIRSIHIWDVWAQWAISLVNFIPMALNGVCSRKIYSRITSCHRKRHILKNEDTVTHRGVMVFFRLKLKTRFLVVFNASNHSGSVRFFILKIYRFFRLQSGRSPPSVLSIRFKKIERMVTYENHKPKGYLSLLLHGR